MAYYGKQKRGRPLKPENAYKQAVQGIYKNYCFHVHNLTYVTNPEAGEKDIKWRPSRFHKDLCDRVQEFVEKPTDRAYEIMIISTPPQHGKSTTITETLPSWYLMKHPDNNVIQVSYGDDLAGRFGKRNLEKVKQFGNIFGVEVDPQKAQARDFLIKGHKGGMISKGIGSGLTGNPAHLIIIDDPIKNRGEADSERTRDSIWNEFTDSILSRTQAGTKIVLIMTRWHEDDLAGRILETMPDITTYVNYECECVSDDDPLGRRKATEDELGEALCPEIGKGDKWLKEFKKGYIDGALGTDMGEGGLRSWEALYQGHPTIQEGNILKKEWWQPYNADDYVEGRMGFDQMIMTLDATFKDNERNDYVALEVWGKRENRLYLVDLVNEHLDFSDTVRKLRIMRAKYPRIGGIYIEDAANGTAVLNVLRNEVMGLIPVKPDKSKEARVNAVSFAIEAGNVYVPRDRKFTAKFVEQCAKFPNDKHDDMVDAMSMALDRLIYSKKGRALRKMQEATGWKFPFESSNHDAKRGVGRQINVV